MQLSTLYESLIVIVLITFFVCLIFRSAFLNFFVQDDFILINNFSQNSLLIDLKNAFSYPTVTHWRPLHNLYFLISGNLFEKNYFEYHLFSFVLHISSCFLIYKISLKIFRGFSVAILSTLFYGVNPLHFVSIFWISGGATAIGFLLFAVSFYSYLRKKELLAICFFLLSLMASEGMISGLVIFYVWEMLMKRSKISLSFLAKLSITSVIFLVIRYLLFTPKIILDVYKIEFSENTLEAFKYYSSRILGFGESSGDVFPTMFLLIFLFLVGYLILKKAVSKNDLRLLLFFSMAVIAGLFPFVLIPGHISAHYMNISAFGFSMIITLALYKQKPTLRLILATLFLISSFLTVNITAEKNWVVKRSNIAKHYIQQIEKSAPPKNSFLVFGDNNFSTSKEAYISLGTGQALKFWFRDKNYVGCFTFFEDCKYGKNPILIN